MWLKLFLLSLYLFCLFVLSRLLETASWDDTGTFVTSFAVLDPISLSASKLKQLLDDRGVSYAGVVEKKELIALVKSSGTPTSDELLEDLSTKDVATESTQFTCGSHFYEEVEDTKDSAWLVQVVTDDSDLPLLPNATWKEVVKKVARFGIRTGVFKCSKDKSLCQRKGWKFTRLILALPQGKEAKEDVILHDYLQLSSTPATVLQWVRNHLSSRVKVIHSNLELNNWLSYSESPKKTKTAHSESSKKTDVRVILFSLKKSCPMFLSALAIKFNGRVTFGTVDTSKIVTYKNHLGSAEPPVYLVVTPEKTIVYGDRKGESFNFKSMELFLKTYVPEINDVFRWSLLFVNALAGFELFFMHSHIWKHLLLYAICAVKYNCGLFFLWLMILALFQFPFMTTITGVSLKCLRYITGSDAASVLRFDYKCFYSYTFLLVTYVMFASIAGYVLRKYKWCQPDDVVIFSDWWQSADSRLTTFFFRPRAPPPRPFANQEEEDLEVGIELLIERMAVPNLWLQPVITMDYVKRLPMWRYNGWAGEDITPEEDDENKSETVYSSDDETLLPAFEVQVAPEDPPSQDQACSSKQKTHSVKKPRPTLPPGLASYVPDFKKPPEDMLKCQECPICLENYRYGEVLCGLPCHHNFHMNCIMAWLSRDNHCCPNCRAPSYRSR